MLEYVLRIRDLVHGTILFTKEEMVLINHPFFQRIRQVRQNDVAFYVYPSINTSRFEHTLGTCRVAGMMAETLTNSPKWSIYAKALRTETGISLRTEKADFVKICRFYALLHDIGHLPLSHLFEYATESWAYPNYFRIIQEWTGFEGFEKLHEAFGALIAKKLIKDIRMSQHIGEAILRLMAEKIILPTNPLSLIKRIIDSDIDADRIDFVQRDGLLAGGEYGHYDVRRLCDSVFIEQREDKWIIAYSEKALTSMEALLLDRYRTYTWVHFHHKVITVKMLVRFLIEKALELKVVTKEHFNPENIKEFNLKDDVWLWNVLRIMETTDKITKMVQEAVFYRKKNNIFNLWKTRPEYHEFYDKVADKAQMAVKSFEKTEGYRDYLVSKMKTQVLIFKVPFKPIGDKATYLYSEARKELTGKNLFEVSKLVASLETIWDDEAQDFVLLVGNNVRSRAKKLKERWVDISADWRINPTLW
ncbi:MAG: HD domain-containing protein [Candidatus Staskawiczbacteria bacterium]|nr:HD domain-containing protein [Candidatus Staskawiczbacteria bacterium]